MPGDIFCVLGSFVDEVRQCTIGVYFSEIYNVMDFTFSFRLEHADHTALQLQMNSIAINSNEHEARSFPSI